jgi:hypothetical protein
MHIAAGVEVALVGGEPSLHLLLLDPNNLDTEVARERARDPLPVDLRIYVDRSSVVPS